MNAHILTEEQIDYLTEMMNIGAGNAATALEQLFKCSVDMNVPDIHIVPVEEAVSIIGEPPEIYAGVRMGMVGDISGIMFLIMPLSQKKQLLGIIEKNILFKMKPGELDVSVLEEIGNITAGCYLMALHDFCKLSIQHTVPVMAVDMLQAILDETITVESDGNSHIILIENEFTMKEGIIKAFFIIALIPSRNNLQILVDSIKAATERMME